MKMTTNQYQQLCDGIDSELNRINLTRNAICSILDCWVLFARWTNRIAVDRPLGYGTSRQWLFDELNDSHINTAFRKMMRECGKTI